MANLGKDFNASRPTDSEFAQSIALATRRGSFYIDEIKDRLKSFFSRLFDLETGSLNDETVSSNSLKDLDPDPSGTYQEVITNSKGLATGGTPTINVTSRIFRAFISGKTSLTSYFETVDGITELTPDDTFGRNDAAGVDEFGACPCYCGDTVVYPFQVRKFGLTVPENVRRMKFSLVGAGGRGDASVDGGDAGYVQVTLPVTPGEVLTLVVGMGGTSSFPSGGPSRVRTSADFVTSPYGLAGAGGGDDAVIDACDTNNISGGFDVSMFLREGLPFAEWGHGSAKAGSPADGQAGVIIVEWYA